MTSNSSMSPVWPLLWLIFGFGKRGLLEKGSFQKSQFSRDSREFRESRDSRESPDCGKQRRIQPLSRDSSEIRDFRDSRDSSSEKIPFVMTPFSGPDIYCTFPLVRNPVQIESVCHLTELQGQKWSSVWLQRPYMKRT